MSLHHKIYHTEQTAFVDNMNYKLKILQGSKGPKVK